MGKASINTCDQGRASIFYETATQFLVRQIAQFDADLAKMDAAIVVAEAQILDFENQLAAIVAQIDDMVEGYATCTHTYGPPPSSEAKKQKPPPPPWPCEGMAEQISDAQKAQAENSAKLYAAKHSLATMKAQKAQVDALRVVYQAELNDATPVMDVWVADWTEEEENPEPASKTGTIEVWGMRNASDTCAVPRKNVILRPQYTPAERPYVVDRDNAISGPMNSESAMVFSHLATWCWVQEHRPRYITAVVLSVDHAAQTITVRRSIPVGMEAVIGVDYTWQATLPVIYRDCRTLAFRAGDRVVVEFGEPGKKNGYVIGFEDNPRGCKFEGWIIGPQVAGPTSIIRDALTGEWSAGPNVAGGYTSWWSNNGEVVSWGGSPRRYWGVPAESRVLYLRGTAYSIPTSRGFVRGACVRKIAGARYLYVISADRSARKDYLFRLAIATESAFTELSAWAWETDEISAVTNTYSTHIYDGWQKQGHVVAFNQAGTAAVTIRGYGVAEARMIQYAIGETSGTRSVGNLPHTKREATSEGTAGISGFATTFLDSDVTIAVDYGPGGDIVDLRYAEHGHFVWVDGGTWSLTERNKLICGAMELVFTDETIADVPYNQGLARTQKSLQLEQVDLRLDNPLITYATYEEDEPPYGTSLGISTPYEGDVREVRTIQGLADDAAENTRLWTSAFWAPSFVSMGERLEINIEGRVDWTVADAATGPQGNYIVNAMTSSHLAYITDGSPLQFTGTCSNVSMFDIALLTGKTAPFQAYGFIPY